ncbi:MAG: hypothetical protein U1D30_23295 [Planctomycetota bacterium]
MEDREEYESRRKRAIQKRMPFARVYRVGLFTVSTDFTSTRKPNFSEDGRYLGHEGVAVDITDCPEERRIAANEGSPRGELGLGYSRGDS